MNYTKLDKHLKTHKQAIDNSLSDIVVDIIPDLQRSKLMKRVLLHNIAGRGKRLRPIMALAIFKKTSKQAVTEDLLQAACAVELIHTGSLMLDDLPSMDDAALRRGRKTSHTVFGESTTILGSAAMWVEAFRILAEVDHQYGTTLTLRATEATGSRGLVYGQMLDLAAFNNAQTVEELESCYRLKTAQLFWLSAGIGGAFAKVTDSEQAILDEFAQQFGVAYQIRDDLVGAVQNETQSGKDSNKDALNRKPNFVSVFGIEKTRQLLHMKTERAMELLNSMPKYNDVMLESLTNRLRDV